ncbi:zinc finger BED domain-containing protein RICESLEEPER 2 [Tanacetum coccineum]
MNYPKEIEETLGTPIEVELLDETQLEDLGLNTCNHDLPLSYREGDNSGSNLGKRKTEISTTRKGKKVKTKGKEKSEWWQYYQVLYDEYEDGNRRKIAKCKYCETRLVTDNVDTSVEGGSSSVATWKHDDDRIYKALIKLFVIGELPFAFVKNEAFVEYTQALNASNKQLETKVEDMVEEVKTKIGELFGTYKERFDFLSSNSSIDEHRESKVTSPIHGDNDFLNDYYNVDATSSYETETELDMYLKEPKIELRKGQSLNILQWWKVNGPRFPIVAKMARDILAIQISTVASKAAFSIGGCVLDPYRTRLSTMIVEALSTQVWVRKSRTQINWDDVEDLIKDDEIVKDMEEQLKKLTGRDKEKETVEI